MNEKATPTKRGRPRDPSLDQAILDAARSLLAKRGFTATSMEEIARTAGVGKDSLYRRWDSKEQLVEHLLSVLAAEHVPVPAEDDPRYALFVFLQDLVRLNEKSDFGGIIAGIVGESARNDDLAAAFHRFWDERRAIAGEIVEAIVGAVDDAEMNRILDHVVGPIYYRLLLSGAPVNDEYLWDLVVGVPWPKERDSNHQLTP